MAQETNGIDMRNAEINIGEAMAIQQGVDGFYYNVTNRAGCWGSGTYTAQGYYEPSNSYMTHNAELIFNYLTDRGWTYNAVMAVLGNFSYECYINPAQTQIGYPIGGNKGGYGLAMWTPQTKYRNWAASHNYNVNSGIYQLEYLDTVTSEWHQKAAYNNMTYDDFRYGNHSVSYLTEAFFDCYEIGTPNAYRQYCAEYYNEYFQGYTPEPPEPPQPDPYHATKRKLPLWLLAKRRIMLYK